jgi:hypothetical protein
MCRVCRQGSADDRARSTETVCSSVTHLLLHQTATTHLHTTYAKLTQCSYHLLSSISMVGRVCNHLRSRECTMGTSNNEPSPINCHNVVQSAPRQMQTPSPNECRIPRPNGTPGRNTQAEPTTHTRPKLASIRPESGWNCLAGSSVVTRHWMMALPFTCTAS